jgi:hypothetical protein
MPTTPNKKKPSIAQLDSRLVKAGVEQPRIDALRQASEQAIAISDRWADDENRIGDGLLRLTQQKLFDSLILVGPEDSATILKLTSAIAAISRAVIEQNKWQVEVKAKIAAKFEQIQAESVRGGKKIDAETLTMIREQIYGLF